MYEGIGRQGLCSALSCSLISSFVSCSLDPRLLSCLPSLTWLSSVLKQCVRFVCALPTRCLFQFPFSHWFLFPVSFALHFFPTCHTCVRVLHPHSFYSTLLLFYVRQLFDTDGDGRVEATEVSKAMNIFKASLYWSVRGFGLYGEMILASHKHVQLVRTQL
jgi:hypothetical protein